MDGFGFENEGIVQSAVLSLRVQAEGREPGTTKHPDQGGQENLERKRQGVASQEMLKGVICKQEHSGWQCGVQIRVCLNCSHPLKKQIAQRPVENSTAL